MTKPDQLTSVQEINSFFENWFDYTDNERLSVIKDIKSKGILTPIKSKPKDSGCRCPLHGFALMKPCSIGECSYHVASPERKNCLIASPLLKKAGKLSTAEAADLLNTTVIEVNTNILEATRKIKKLIIKETLEKSEFSRFKYLRGHCICCELYDVDMESGGATDELTVICSDKTVFAWCSEECATKKPKWQFLLEKEFGFTYLEVIAAAVTLFKKLDHVDLLLQLEPGTTESLKSLLAQKIEDLV
jgi:hypothetical protein